MDYEENTGYIKIYRSVMNHWLWIEKPFSKFEAWLWLLLRANYKNGKINFGFELFEIKRGQFISSQEKLSQEFGWSRNQVRSFLSLLENDKMIIAESTSKFTKITICNYDKYQNSLPTTLTTTQQRIDNGLTTTQQRIDTNNKGKESKEGEESKYAPAENFQGKPEIKEGYLEKELKNSFSWLEQNCRTFRIDLPAVNKFLDQFISEQKAADNFNHREFSDLKSHFPKWLKIEISKPKEKQGSGLPSHVAQGDYRKLLEKQMQK